MPRAILPSRKSEDSNGKSEDNKIEHEALQVCYTRGELDNEGIKGYLPEKRGRITFGEGATRLHLEE